MQHIDTPQRLLLVKGNCRVPSTTPARQGLTSPYLSESKHSQRAYFTAALFSSPFFVLKLIRLNLFHQALFRPYAHEHPALMNVVTSELQQCYHPPTRRPCLQVTWYVLPNHFLLCLSQLLLLVSSRPSDLYDTATVPLVVSCV